jgi:hypothetical protein
MFSDQRFCEEVATQEHLCSPLRPHHCPPCPMMLSMSSVQMGCQRLYNHRAHSNGISQVIVVVVCHIGYGVCVVRVQGLCVHGTYKT